jgi:3-oxoacyl-ACP reductase-like protein
MSIFGKIMSSIFGHASAQTPQAAPPPAGKTSTSADAGSAPAASASTSTSASGSPNAGPAVEPHVDVEAILTKLASQNKEKLDWRSSIVDLMKLLDLDSSLSARKELAKELNYTGDMNNSAGMNVWLHKQVMIKLAENGGKVPDSLKG